MLLTTVLHLSDSSPACNIDEDVYGGGYEEKLNNFIHKCSFLVIIAPEITAKEESPEGLTPNLRIRL